MLILDEPTAGLDPRGRDEILAQIRAYHETKAGHGYLVSHSMEGNCPERGAHRGDAGCPRLYGRHAPAGICTGGGAGAGGDWMCRRVTKIAMALRRRGMDIDPAVYTIEELEQALLARRGGGEGC